MELLGDVGHVESRLVRLEIVLTKTQDRCKFALNVHWSQKSFWTHPMELLCDEAQVESRFGPFGVSVSISAR